MRLKNNIKCKHFHSNGEHTSERAQENTDVSKASFANGTHSCSNFPRRVRYVGFQRSSVRKRHKDDWRIIMEIAFGFVSRARAYGTYETTRSYDILLTYLVEL